MSLDAPMSNRCCSPLNAAHPRTGRPADDRTWRQGTSTRILRDAIASDPRTPTRSHLGTFTVIAFNLLTARHICHSQPPRSHPRFAPPKRHQQAAAAAAALLQRRRRRASGPRLASPSTTVGWTHGVPAPPFTCS